MNNQVNAVETMTYRRTEFHLAQHADGFWGWAVGNHVMAPMFYYRTTALKSAQKFIDDLKSQPLF